MCGLAGIFDSRGEAPISEALLTSMRERLVHRGPDGYGNFVAPGIGLAHRRLAIVDLSGGHQPLFNEDGTVVVVFNGEIYNFRTLVRQLEDRGHVFRTHSDTEVIVHGWEEWGPACVEHFHGMFALAVWDATRRTLFLARDRLGKKPLFLAELADGRLFFASELKALLACPDIRRRIDPLAIEEYLCFGYVPDPRSIYRGITKLPPAHRLVWQRGSRPKTDAYWCPRLDGAGAIGDTAAAELTHRLQVAVAERLIADVPLGAFLSGGVDSSGVVAVMAGLVDKPVNTFCISFAEKAFDESAYAAAVARRYQTRHRVRRVDRDDFALVDRLPAIFDEPFGDNSALPTYRICAVAREEVTVALSGDGGDEALAGYRRYRLHLNEEKVRSNLPSAWRRPLFGTLARTYPKLDWAPRWLRAKTTFHELALGASEAYGHSVAVITEGLRHALYSPQFRAELQGYRAQEVLDRHWTYAAAETEDPLRQAQYVDIKTWLPGDILVKVDRASMAVSLEVRAPLLDHQLVEWSLSLPSHAKVRGGQGKWALKKSLEPYVPRDLLYRPKQGFSSPLAAWFRGGLAGRLDGMAERLAASGYFDGAQIRRLADQHRSRLSDHGAVLWSLLMLDGFLQHERP